MATSGELGSSTLIVRTPGKPPVPAAGHAILCFDGVCLLCSSFIQFVLDHDAAERFIFCSCAALPPMPTLRLQMRASPRLTRRGPARV